jgi:hypothetical protein
MRNICNKKECVLPLKKNVRCEFFQSYASFLDFYYKIMKNTRPPHLHKVIFNQFLIS